MSESRRHTALVFAVCTATLLWRGWARLWPATLWAEDAVIFLSEAQTLGSRAFLEPYAGYLHFLPRVFGFFAVHAPLRWVPLADYLVCLVMYAGVVTWFATDAFASAIPDRGSRAIAAWLACFAPGTQEVLGNFANVHSLAFLLLSLLLVARWNDEVRAGDLVLVFVLGTTAGESIVLLPLIIAFAIVGLRNPSRRRHLWLSLVFALTVLGHLWAYLHWPGRQGQQLEFERAHWVTVSTVAQHYVTGPWLSASALRFYELAPKVLPIVVGWLGAVLAVAWGFKTKRLLFVCAMFAWSGVILVSTIVRPDNDLNFLGLWGGVEPVFRQDFLGAIAAIFLWCAVLQRRFAVLVFAVCYLFGTDPYWRFPPHPQADAWGKQSERLERIFRGEDPGPIAIPIAPEGFMFIFPPSR